MSPLCDLPRVAQVCCRCSNGRRLRMLAFGQGKSERSIRMTLSLAFIAPPIVVAAIEGRLPREITSIWADFLVELRGFELLTSAVQGWLSAPARDRGPCECQKHQTAVYGDKG